MVTPGSYWSADSNADTDPIPVQRDILHTVAQTVGVDFRNLFIALGNLQDGLSVAIDARLASDEYERIDEDERTWYVHIPAATWRDLYARHNHGETTDARFRAAKECHARQVDRAPVVEDDIFAEIPGDRHVLAIAKPTHPRSAIERSNGNSDGPRNCTASRSTI